MILEIKFGPKLTSENLKSLKIQLTHNQFQVAVFYLDNNLEHFSDQYKGKTLP